MPDKPEQPAVDVRKLPPQPPSQQLQQQQHGQHKYPLTGFFKRIHFQLDPEHYPDDSKGITWEKLQHRWALCHCSCPAEPVIMNMICWHPISAVWCLY